MTKALITGGTGFIGSHVARALIEAGHTVRVLYRLGARLDILQNLPVEHAVGDVLDPASLDQAMDGCEWVFHTAAVADYWRAQRTRMYMVNVHGTRHVLQAAQRAGVRRVILTSSAAAVGLRSDGRASDEGVVFNLPPSRFPYGHSKHLSEQEALRAVNEAGQDVVILNPAMVLGPGDLNLISGSMVVEAARGLIPPVYPVGSVTIIDVRDVARAHVAAAERGRTGERYLLGAEDWKYKDLWTLIAQLVGGRAPALPLPAALSPLTANLFTLMRSAGVRLPVNADQVWLSARDLCFDSTKARRDLGAPQISVARSVEETYHWYVQHGFIDRARKT